jgi:DNA-binding response OmpR family regulator
MKILNAIVDDEPPAIRLLEKYVSKVPFRINWHHNQFLRSAATIEEGNVDLVLDIQMPDLTFAIV